MHWFVVACVAEAALGVIALLILGFSGRTIPAMLQWNFPDLLLGAASAIPLFAILLLLMRAPFRWCLSLRRVLDEVVRPLFRDWSLGQLAVISLLAGICEELLFRGALQELSANWLGDWGALLGSSLLFGAAHLLTLEYGLLAAIIGGYFGLLYLECGNLLVPMLAHAIYDFVALVYVLRVGWSDPKFDKSGSN